MSVCKIAVIDDERPARKELILQIRAILPESEIEEAESGSGGMELLSRGFFDLIFIDMHLNDMEGTTLALAARKLYPEAKIVFATAYSQYAVRAFEIGADDYILKPFDPERIKAVITKFQRGWEGVRDDARPALDGKLAINVNRSIFLLDISQLGSSASTKAIWSIWSILQRYSHGQITALPWPCGDLRMRLFR